MNSLKTLFVVAVLGAVAYGVYVSINRSPETPASPNSGTVWPPAPPVEILGPGAASPQFPPAGSAAEINRPLSSDPMATAPVTPYAPLPDSASPSGNPADGAPSPYPPSGSDWPSDVAVSPSGPPTAGNPQARSGLADDPGLHSNSLRGTQEPVSGPLSDGSVPSGSTEKFAAFMQAVRTKLDAGELTEVHLALSSIYDNPSVPPERAQEVTGLLDQLAGTVIYSRKHLLEQPYRVRPGDTLERIAEIYKVPWQLLARINAIRDPQRLEPGRELKVVRGPFSALIDLGKYELTLMVGDRYAGRFPIGVGSDHATLEGSYIVRDKILTPPYYSPTVNFAPNDPNNPLGRHWIDLGSQIGIHGTNDPQNLHRTGGRGSVCLGDRDIEDLFGILAVGSQVIIRR